MSAACDPCARIERAERGENPFAVVRTATGYVNLADVQYHEGYTIFVAKQCVHELHELPAAERDLHLHEMALIAEAVFEAFRPRKHDARPRGPVWEDPGFLRALDRGASPEPERLATLRAQLRSALDDTDLTIEQRFG